MSLSLELRFHVCLLVTITAVHGQVPGPNAVASINGQTMLDCTTIDLAFSNWRYTLDGNSNYLTISSGCNPVTGSNAAYYRTQLIGTNICRLIIANVTMQQAGVYVCYNGATTTFISLVTVIDSVANVVVYNQSEVVEGDILNISCSINYNGPASPAPSLRPLPYWETSSGQSLPSSVDYPSTNVVTLTATLTAQKPTVPVFQCRTVFEIVGNTSGYNLTAPSDNLTVGRTTELDVQYVPSIPVVTSTCQILQIHGIACEVGVLTCSSSGNPQPTYEWFETNGNVKISNEITFDLAEINRNYTCLVKNTIRNVAHQELSFHVQTSQTNVQDCDFPRNESTSIIVAGCEDTSSCVCSHGAGGLALVCDAVTYPNALYIWKGAGGNVVYSPVNIDIASNGTYQCAAYFDRLLSNYTGNGTFPNGSSEKIVTECSISITASPTPTMESATSTSSACAYQPVASSSDDVALAMGVLFAISLVVNITILCIWIYNRLRKKQDASKKPENVHRPDNMMDLSNGTSAPRTYEELNRPDASQLNLDTYQELTLS